MIRYRLLITLVCLCMFCTVGIGSVKSDVLEGDGLILAYDNVMKVDVNAGGPLCVNHQKYNYTTAMQNEIVYIIHYLNSFHLRDDGKDIYANDADYYSIKIYNNDSVVENYGFWGNRFTMANNKQYAGDIVELKRFLDFIHALKAKKIMLPDAITFEPSEWAKADVVKAVERGLVPTWNQINYMGDITRLEVCQLVSNFLEIKGYTAAGTRENPFADTSDTSVLMLYELKILRGKTESEFCPYDFITREELAKILSNTYHYVKDDINFKDGDVPYKDQDKISDWAISSVKDMTALGVFVGNQAGEFAPQKNITKEEVVITLQSLDEIIQ